MAKIDLKHAFRNCPVHPSDWELLSMHRKNKPYLFNKVANAMEWILHYRYKLPYVLHYLDDFFVAGPARSTACQHAHGTVLALCHELGAPVKPEKIEGPTTFLSLGMELVTMTMEARLPLAQKTTLLKDLRGFKGVTKCIQRELLSLIEKMSFACKVVPAGRIFLRWLIDLSKGF